MLELEGINAFYGRSHVLYDISLQVKRGEVVVLLGRNGAGKTTTMNSIIGFIRPRSGTLTLEGNRLDRLPPHRRVREGLGFVPQGGRAFAGLTVRENLEIVRGRAASDGDGWVPERAFEVFPPLRRVAGRDAGLLSGGERQMMAVARALMANPLAILLDEPSEGLAPAIVQSLGQLIRLLRDHQIAVLLTEQSHRFALEVADRAYVIEKGRIVHEAPADELAGSAELERYLGV